MARALRPGAPARASRRAFGALLLLAPGASALGRTPLGGTLRLSVPFSTRELDPHAGDSAIAALFAPAVADPLFALDEEGRPYAALAEALPERTAEGARLTLRAGLVSARGKRLDARDVAFSLARAARLGGAATLGELPAPSPDARDRLALVFPGADPTAVAVALASPLTALVPRGFSAARPDGTGAFRATVTASGLTLERNVVAARGPAFLERVEVTRAAGLADALRAFESARADVGWLGAGLHQPRRGSVALAGPDYGLLVLRTGREARAWAAPGIAQGLLDRVPPGALAHLGVRDVGGTRRAGALWDGGAAELVVASDEPMLGEIAEALAGLLAPRAGTLAARGVPPSELAARRATGAFALMLDFVRLAGPPGRATLLALLAATSPELARRPPRPPSYEPRDVARTLPLGVVGALHVTGARVPELGGLEHWQLGNAYLTPNSAPP